MNTSTARGAHRERGIRPVIRHGRSRSRLPWRGALTVVGALTLGVLLGGSPTSSARGVAHGGPTGTTPVEATIVVPGSSPAFEWPKVGQAAVAVRGIGIVGRSPHERRVPIASLTKMMTALVVLHDHPLAPGESGPEVQITRADAEVYETEAVAGDSTVKVVAGETLSEFQLLEALLIPSGDNIADKLATWDAGSIGRFVVKMNAMAGSLGLTRTHYADASGVSPLSVSTAADQARLAADLMGNTVVRGIVRKSHLAFPVAKKIWNANPATGTDGIIGVKSGWTFKASGCLVTAAFRTVRQQGVLVISAVLGQPDGLWEATDVDEALLDATTAALVAYEVAPAGATVATVPLPAGDGDAVLVAPNKARFAIVWRGLELTEWIVGGADLSPSALARDHTGSVVGALTVVAPWGVVAQFPLRLGVVPATASTASG
jgi:D-alanyl-D-alanine carboxypeptidase (penicillin-binding protein 5/6)